MIDPKHEVSITRQAELLGISRSAVYYVPRPIPEADLALMRRIDELHLEYPFAGARTLRDLLEQEGVYAGRKHIGTLMARVIFRHKGATEFSAYRSQPIFGILEPVRFRRNGASRFSAYRSQFGVGTGVSD